MKLILKSLSGTKTHIEADPGSTVQQLKVVLAPHLGLPAPQLRLLLAGRVLADTHSLEECGVQDKTQIVYMQARQRAVIPQDEELAVGEEYEARLQRLVDSGYERPLAAAALREAGNEEERAREMLEEGAELDCDDEEKMYESQNPLSFLLGNEAFLQVRKQLQTTPGLLTALLDQLQLYNPALFCLVSQYSDAFQELLDAPEEEFQLSDQDRAVVDKLTALGFSEEEALTAYLQCERDEARATQLLLENYYQSS